MNRTVVFEKGENALQDHVHVKSFVGSGFPSRYTSRQKAAEKELTKYETILVLPLFLESNGSGAFDDLGSRLLSPFAIRFSERAQMLKAVCLIVFKRVQIYLFLSARATNVVASTLENVSDTGAKGGA